ncbi:hypothetical protein, partial [Albimonas pacifica]
MLPAIVPLLASVAASVGAPLVERVLAGRIGAGNASLVSGMVKAIAGHAGVAPEELPELHRTDPDRLAVSVTTAEVDAAPELIALYASELESKTTLLLAEMREPRWTWAWRPLGMYGIGALWFWNVIVLHVLNAVFKIALPQMPLGELFNLTALFLGLYMGGHTVKDAVGKVASR